MTGLVLAGGTLVDGTGTAPRRADVVVRDGLVESVVAPGTAPPGLDPVDVTGRLVCPGFVDIHTHSDLTLLSNPLAHSKVRQGVTTEVVGNCGLGVAPVGFATDPDTLRGVLAYLDLDPAVQLSWRTVAEYLDVVAAHRPSPHVATLVGHVPVRAAVLGFDDRPATTAEIDLMCALVAQALEDGALGLSTGLVYPPLRAARTDELRALAQVVADHDALFAWHLRDYADDLLASAAEAVGIAELTGARTQISHLSSIGVRNWGRAREVLAMATDGADGIGFDIYPYLAGNAPLSQLLPEPVTVDALGDPVAREQVARAWVHNPVPWTEITVAGGAAADVLGRTVADLAGRNRTGSDVAMDLIARHGHSVIMTAGGRSEHDLRAVLDHPATVVASDGLALDPDGPTGRGFPHPRSYGTFPRALTDFGGDLAAMVRKCTAAPAARVGLTDRGTVAPGQLADLVVLDAEHLTDHATFTRPQRFPTGVEYVLVAGTMVVAGGTHTGSRPGNVVRRASMIER